MAELSVQLNPVELAKILNKSSGDAVTYKEWNEIHTLLVEQQNIHSTQIVNLSKTIDDILNGRVSGLTVNTNVTEFGGHKVEEFALKTDLTSSTNTITTTMTTELAKKQDKLDLVASRALVANASGVPESANPTIDEVNQLVGVTSPIQTQLNGKLGTSAKAYDTARIAGKRIFCQTSAPSNPQVNDLWISW